MSVDSVFGGCLAFICAAIAVGSDAQAEIRSRFGRRYGTFILGAREGYLFILAWGIVDVAFYIAFLFNHDWAKRAFNIEIEPNLLWTGIVVGLSAILIFRTNLATINGFQIGGELLYSFSRAYLIDNLNRARLRARREFLAQYRPYFRNTASYRNYFSSLEKVLKDLSAGSDKSAEIDAQLTGIKAAVAPPGDPDMSTAAREGLTGLVYDYFGPTEVQTWAANEDYGNK